MPSIATNSKPSSIHVGGLQCRSSTIRGRPVAVRNTARRWCSGTVVMPIARTSSALLPTNTTPSLDSRVCAAEKPVKSYRLQLSHPFARRALLPLTATAALTIKTTNPGRLCLFLGSKSPLEIRQCPGRITRRALITSLPTYPSFSGYITSDLDAKMLLLRRLEWDWQSS